jgi:plastocyanin
VITAPALTAGVCSATPLTVQALDACGAPFFPANALPVTLTSSSPTLQRFSDSACTFEPGSWAIPAGASGFDLYVQDPTPGMPTLTASSTGLDAGSAVLAIGCPGNQRACPTGCVPNGGCCSDTECDDGGVAWVCNANNRCAPPPCTGFPANCTMFDDRTLSTASRTITFDSSGYVPKCMRVTTSQDVTFSGTFVIHPLVQVCGPSDAQLTTTFGTTKTARFSSFGTYGYRCANHPVFEQGAIRTP